MDMSKDALDHLCATDPIWIGALQIVQLARKQAAEDMVQASAQLACAIVLLASDAPNPQAFLDHCADSLKKTPLGNRRL